MEELQLTLTQARVDQRNFGVMLSNWRVGQMLNALVVNTRPDGAVLLSVGGKQFVATTDIPVQPGTRMALEVKQVGQEIVLKRIQDQVLQPGGANARAAETALTLSSAKPSALLNQLAAQPARFGSPDMQAAVRELLGKTLRGENIRPGELKSALRNSGLFTEADLAQGRTDRAGQSTKVTLSQIQAMTLAMAKEMDEDSLELRVLRQISEKTAGLLNGIAQNQLASLPGDEGGSRWVFTLPVQLNEQFHDVRMQIEQEPPGEDDNDEASWRASLSVDLPQLGAVDINVRMVGEAVSVNFVCDEASSSRVLQSAMATLEQRLEQRELKIGRLSADTTTDTSEVEPGPSGPGRSFSAEA